MAENKDEATPRLLSRDEQREAAQAAEQEAAQAEYNPVTAQIVAATVGAVPTDNEKEKALEAGVVSSAFIDYESALENYESRADVEPLAERRARESGVSFHDAAFRRQVAAVDNVGVVATDTATVDDKAQTVVKPAVNKASE